LFDSELAVKMKNSGCSYVKIGVEGGTQKMLDVMSKHTILSQVKESFDIAHNAGLKTCAYVMLGFPGIPIFEYDDMYDFIKNLKSEYYVVNVTIPYPGTEMGKQIMNDPETGSIYKEFLGTDGDAAWIHLSRDFALKLWKLPEELLNKFFNMSFVGKEDGEIRKFLDRKKT
jgi:radical SAM superfamily enzyme YgiQ (UPF0313 family)